MSNRLATAASLYLRQHGDDPVDWWPWCDEALALAAASDRPILLSIGYSACHWCHVMAHETFSDAAVAERINALFVAIKVDREERPDLDRAFQLAHQAKQHRPGGWPLTVFLDPHQHLPFFIGTYFPATSQHGLPGLGELLPKLADWYSEHRQSWADESKGLANFLADYGVESAESGRLDRTPIDLASQRLLNAVDWQYGGRTGAPKFPAHSEMAWALARLPRWVDGDAADLIEQMPIDTLAQQSAMNALLSGQQREGGAPEHALFSLSRIVDSGLHDHLGGGFFRYCIDEDWGVPHFEKMLFDNAQMLSNLAEAQRIVPSKSWRDAAVGIVRWLQEEMALPEGGFGSSLDADSEGREGANYLWTRDEWEGCLGQDAAWMAKLYGLDRPANVDASHWHLRRCLDDAGVAELAQELNLDDEACRRRIAELRRRLQLQRARRPAPQRDDKCLAAANGLTLRGLAQAASAFSRSDWLQLAVTLRDQLMARLRSAERLRCLDYADRRGGPGFLDDYAAMLLGVMELLHERFDPISLEWACELAEALLHEFEHQPQGGFWFSAHQQSEAPHRGKPVLDEAVPSGNAMAAEGLQRLGTLLAEPRYLAAAERALRAAWPSLSKVPEACCSMLGVLEQYLQPRPLLVARLSDVNEHTRWRKALDFAERNRFRVYTLPASDSLLSAALESKRWLSGGRVYWCEGLRCRPRYDSPVALATAIIRFAESGAG